MANAQDARAADAAQWATCRHCGEAKLPEHFYVSDKTGCKECIKTRVRANREAKADYYQAYDRKRYREDDARKEAARKSAASEAGVRARVRAKARIRAEAPEKLIARNAVNNALRDRKIARTPCFFCGSEHRLQAHHEDYSHPLDVVWLCASCHGKLHTIKGDFRRAGK